MSFSDLGLAPDLLDAVAHLGWTEPTPIQAAALPLVLKGRDVRAQAKTGSGKTGAFGLGLLQHLQPGTSPRALVLCPTRELAEQVGTELRALASRRANLRLLVACGGRPVRDQARVLGRGVDVVVGTPGRIGALIRREDLALAALGTLVLDEADRMLDMGFADQVLEIVGACPRRRRTWLFSATFPRAVHDLADAVQRDPARVGLGERVEAIEQEVFLVPHSERHDLVARLLSERRPRRALVFCETRSDCDRLARFLRGRGASALALHGDLEQRDRDDVLVQLANDSLCVLVATNVAARGLDIPQLPLVLISELSGETASHVHRIGRTGRAGESGVALSIVCGDAERDRLARVEQAHGPIPRGRVPTARPALEFLQPPNRTLLILGGRQHKLRKGDVLGALIHDAGVPDDAIGRIDVRPEVTAVAIQREHAEAALAWSRGGRIKKRRFRARLL